jgi:hypothetical protein
MLTKIENQPYEQAGKQNGDRTEQHNPSLAAESVVKEEDHTRDCSHHLDNSPEDSLRHGQHPKPALTSDQGLPDEDAIWTWRLLLYPHWGKHAMDALLTIHFRLQNAGA